MSLTLLCKFGINRTDSFAGILLTNQQYRTGEKIVTEQVREALMDSAEDNIKGKSFTGGYQYQNLCMYNFMIFFLQYISHLKTQHCDHFQDSY